MTAAITLLVKFGPWLGMALAALAAWISHKNSVAKVATAQASVAQVITTIAEVKTAEATASAAVSEASKQAVQNVSDAAAVVASATDAENRKALQDEFGRPQ